MWTLVKIDYLGQIMEEDEEIQNLRMEDYSERKGKQTFLLGSLLSALQ